MLKPRLQESLPDTAPYGGPPANHNGFTVDRGAFTQSLTERGVKMLWNHNSSEAIGKWLDAEEDDYGLKLRGQIDKNVQRGAEALSLIASGAVTGLSIGAYVDEGGARKVDDYLAITKAQLFEVSVVPLPAEERARVLSVRATRDVNLSSIRDFERWLREAGCARSVALKLASGGWKGFAGGTDVDEYAAARLLDRVRRASIDLKRNVSK